MGTQPRIDEMTEKEKLESLEITTEIFKKVMEINLKTSFCAFMDISGHCNNFDLSVRQSKECYPSVIYECDSVYYDLKISREWATTILGELDKFLNQEKIIQWKVCAADRYLSVNKIFSNEQDA